MDKNTKHSNFREKLIEHALISELLKISWRSDACSLEISKPEVDAKGYDVLAEENGIIRHIQLKSSLTTSRISRQKVHLALGKKPSGCIVWVMFNEETMKLGPFLFLGGSAGEPFPAMDGFQVAKHTKGDATGEKKERPDLRVVPKGMFTVINSVEEMYETLFVTR